MNSDFRPASKQIKQLAMQHLLDWFSANDASKYVNGEPIASNGVPLHLYNRLNVIMADDSQDAYALSTAVKQYGDRFRTNAASAEEANNQAVFWGRAYGPVVELGRGDIDNDGIPNVYDVTPYGADTYVSEADINGGSGVKEGGGGTPGGVATGATGGVTRQDIINAFKKYLDRDPGNDVADSMVNMIKSGTPADVVFAGIIEGPEAQQKIKDVYKKYLGRDAKDSDVTNGINLMKGGMALDVLEAGVRGSQEARNGIDAIYQKYLGRLADPVEENVYINGGWTKAQIDSLVNGSVEYQQNVRKTFLESTGREPTNNEMISYTKTGTSLSRMRDIVTNSNDAKTFAATKAAEAAQKEAVARNPISSVGNNTANQDNGQTNEPPVRVPQPTAAQTEAAIREAEARQNASNTATGSSNSSTPTVTAKEVRQLYMRILDREPTPEESSRLVNSGTTSTSVRDFLINGSDNQQNIRKAYQDLTGSQPTVGQVRDAQWEMRDNNLSINDVRGYIANSPAARSFKAARAQAEEAARQPATRPAIANAQQNDTQPEETIAGGAGRQVAGVEPAPRIESEPVQQNQNRISNILNVDNDPPFGPDLSGPAQDTSGVSADLRREQFERSINSGSGATDAERARTQFEKASAVRPMPRVYRDEAPDAPQDFASNSLQDGEDLTFGLPIDSGPFARTSLDQPEDTYQENLTRAPGVPMSPMSPIEDVESANRIPHGDANDPLSYTDSVDSSNDYRPRPMYMQNASSQEEKPTDYASQVVARTPAADRVPTTSPVWAGDGNSAPHTVTVRGGGSITKLIMDVAAKSGNSISPQKAWQVYTQMKDDFANMEGTYVMKGGHIGLQRQGTYEIDQTMVDKINSYATGVSIDSLAQHNDVLGARTNVLQGNVDITDAQTDRSNSRYVDSFNPTPAGTEEDSDRTLGSSRIEMMGRGSNLFAGNPGGGINMPSLSGGVADSGSGMPSQNRFA